MCHTVDGRKSCKISSILSSGNYSAMGALGGARFLPCTSGCLIHQRLFCLFWLLFLRSDTGRV